jgi:hypothetical protein
MAMLPAILGALISDGLSAIGAPSGWGNPNAN